MRYVSILVAGSLLAFPLVPVSSAADAPAADTTVKTIDPKNLDDLRGARNQAIAVEGKLVRAGESKNKQVRYLNFTNDYREGCALVFFANKGGDAFAIDKLQSWIGKTVRATGKVTEYGSQMQIEIENWDQVKEIPPKVEKK